MSQPVPDCPVCGAPSVSIATMENPEPRFLCTGNPSHEWTPNEEQQPDRVEFYLAMMVGELQAIRSLLEAKQ